jgi:1-acyl-sn-glycerol-3-phosphate acyltransferase
MIWRACYYIIRFLLHCMAVPLFRFTAEGIGNIPATGPIILASNHASNLDPLFIGVAAPRFIHYLAKKELFSNPVFEFVLRKICGALPVDRDQMDRTTLREVFALLQRREMLLVFPEGTRTHDGRLGEAKLGVGLIAHHARATVIPAYVRGSYEILPRHAKRIHLNRCAVSFGPPVELDALYRQGKSKEVYKRIGDRIMESIRRLEESSRQAV